MKENSKVISVAFKDSTAIVGLSRAGLFGSWRQMGIPSFTTDLVLHEIEDTPDWSNLLPFIEDRSLAVEEIEGSVFNEIRNTIGRFGTMAERSVLYFATKKNATVVAGTAIESTAKAMPHLLVKNPLWMIEILVKKSILSSRQAQESLEILVNSKSCQLSKSEVENLMRSLAA